ncbi:hypothetical protein Val02_45400 [Virgisporangium aliadipatigenens]|uniref:Uncharacterized protein n=1 Tax=Virgisporangium aliadipatigenens TaxID=741659 RepID=A0A8J3YLG2_9ACTN|nr:hypothetical protein [Virgisporangium aliadipatigenens]GIJ47654.1 hypothetical protein Val02_45400 [Virgisporangium aliadipatigenens]
MPPERRVAGARLPAALTLLAGAGTVVSCIACSVNDAAGVGTFLGVAGLLLLTIGLAVWTFNRSANALADEEEALDRRLDDVGVRAVARIVRHEPQWHVLTLDLELPAGTLRGVEYTATVDERDLAAFAALGRLPCLIVPGEERPAVRLYPRCGVDDPVLRGDTVVCTPIGSP